MKQGIIKRIGIFTATVLISTTSFATESSDNYKLELPKKVKGNIAFAIAKSEFNKGNIYESLVSYSEGLFLTPYKDNIGVAIGNGWNVSMQTREDNYSIAKAIGMSDENIKRLLPLSLNTKIGDIPKEVRKISLTPEQAMKAARFKRYNMFESSLREMVDGYDKLQENEKAALSYHVYKVGPQNTAKYKNLLSRLQDYISNPNEKTKEQVARNFTYTYMLDGKRMVDMRGSKLIMATWLDPQAFGYHIGATKRPKSYDKVLSITKELQTRLDKLYGSGE